MKASLQWLRHLVPEIGASDDEIVAALSRVGLHVRSVQRLQGDLSRAAPADGELPAGVPLEDAMPPAFDTIVDLMDGPRVDVMGHVGLARELAAVLQIPFLPPPVDAPIRVAVGRVESRTEVDVFNPERCPHFGLLVVEDVVTDPSPLWLRVRLDALGVAPSSRLADLAHLVTLESGHPVECVDLDAIQGPMRVRRAEDSEGFTDEQGARHSLCDDDLVIADDLGPLALAGIAGSARCAVRPESRRVVLMCACYEPAGIGRSADRYGFDTEASRRHRRGVDRSDAAEVLAQAGAVATRLARGSAVPGAIHVFDQPWQAPQIVVHHPRLARECDDSIDQARDALERLGFGVVPLRAGSAGEDLQVSVPSFRQDIHDEDDVIREVVRILRAWQGATAE